MKLMAYDENDNTREVNELWFDGYEIGERQLEGLPIKVTLNESGIQASADWPKGVDAKHWTSVAIDFAQDHDVFATTMELADDDGFIDHE